MRIEELVNKTLEYAIEPRFGFFGTIYQYFLITGIWVGFISGTTFLFGLILM